jgi:uncharacterized protein with PQ loop repeat
MFDFTPMQLVGMAGSLLLALCGLPEMIYSLKHKTCRVPSSLLWLWFTGELCSFAYILYIQDYVLTPNYLCNIVILGVCIYYWVKERIGV